MEDVREQEALNRAEEMEALEAESAARAPQGRQRFARERFRATFRRALILMALLPIAALVGIIGLILSSPSNPPPLVGLVIFAAVLTLLYGAWFLNWRCPVCGGYLGGGFWGFLSVRHCVRCGAKLD